MITTHEGHGWERMAFFAARKANPSIHCIGYTHAPLFEKQHAVKRPLSYAYNPDRIFTSGPIQKNQLEKSKVLKIPIDTLGSARVNKVKTHNERKKTKNMKKFSSSCLVIPEGIESEINLLYEFSLKCAQNFPDLKFIWRLHPLFSFKNLSVQNNMYNSLPDNIKLSEKSLEEDFEICQWVLYRGSSAVIQAVGAGLKPIYLHKQGELKIDPLYEINHWKEMVMLPFDLHKIMKNKIEVNDQFQQAVDYCRKIYIPFNHKPIIQILGKLDNNG